jgi:hypothetical protein
VPPTGILCALLACPPTTSGTRTVNALAVASRCLQLPTVSIANLLCVPARDTSAMSKAGIRAAAWDESRAELASAVGQAEVLIAAWGVGPLTGPARQHQRVQIAWLMQTAQASGHAYVWTMGGQPRHPSRWHQFASDRHGRTAPDSAATSASEGC